MGGKNMNMEGIVKENIGTDMPDTPIKRQGFEFVKFAHRAEDALLRRKTVKEAYEAIEKAITDTCGDMPRDLALLYEEMAEIMRNIMAGENGVMRMGR